MGVKKAIQTNNNCAMIAQNRQIYYPSFYDIGLMLDAFAEPDEEEKQDTIEIPVDVAREWLRWNDNKGSGTYPVELYTIIREALKRKEIEI